MIRFWDFKLTGAPPLLSWVFSQTNEGKVLEGLRLFLLFSFVANLLLSTVLYRAAGRPFIDWYTRTFKLLVREVRAGKRGRFGATVVYGLAVPVTGAVPLIVAAGARWLGSLTGFVIAFGAAVLFGAGMLLQVFTGSGRSSAGDQR